MTFLVQVNGLTVDYSLGGTNRDGRNTLRALDDVSFELGEGETLGVVGESGCGKSTLARALTGLVQTSAGSIRWSRRGEPHAAGALAQMVFQDPLGSLDPRMTIAESVAEPLTVLQPPPGREAVWQQVEEMLGLVGLPASLADRYPHELSGGQCQRVGIARALVPRPALLVADEAVSALDVSIQCQIVNLLLRLQRQLGISLAFISHNIAVTRHVSDRMLVMYCGRVVESGPAVDICNDPRHPYTQALIAAVPQPRYRQNGSAAPSAPAAAVPAGPARPGTGCAYRHRCSRATGRCALEVPAIRNLDRRRQAACHLA